MGLNMANAFIWPNNPKFSIKFSEFQGGMDIGISLQSVPWMDTILPSIIGTTKLVC